MPIADLQRAVEAYQEGRLSQRSLLHYVKWETAVSDRNTVSTFLAQLQDNRNLDSNLVDEVTRTYAENVQHWVFPEEPELSKALPDAVECTFPELIQSFHRARGVLRHVGNMLVGVNVRLNLRSTHRNVGEALRLVMDELALLERACEHVGTGTLLAPEFPGEEDLGRPSWSTSGGAPLSPRQIVGLAELGQRRPESTVSYEDGISRHPAPPQLVTEQIQAAERQRISAERNQKLEQETTKAMSMSCPRCFSAPGALCRSKAGKETTMHQGRYPAAS